MGAPATRQLLHVGLARSPLGLRKAPDEDADGERDFLDGFGPKFDVVGGNHDLEGIDEFFTDESNLEVYLRELGKKTPQFCHEVADKTP